MLSIVWQPAETTIIDRRGWTSHRGVRPGRRCAVGGPPTRTTESPQAMTSTEIWSFTPPMSRATL